MLQLLEAISTTIERSVVGRVPLVAPASGGASQVVVESARRYRPGDQLAIFNLPTADAATVAEVRTVACVLDDCQTITLTEPLTADYANAAIEKTVHGHFLQGVYLGEPVISNFPAITISAGNKTNEPLACGGTLKSTYEIEITVLADGVNHQSQYRAMLTYAAAIERSLFRSFIPLVAPYFTTTLAADVNEGDDTIITTDPLPCLGQLWLENVRRRDNVFALESLGSNTYRLATRLPAYAAGSTAIKPFRGFYASMPASIDYGAVNQNNTTVKAARIHYVVAEEAYSMPYADPLTM